MAPASRNESRLLPRSGAGGGVRATCSGCQRGLTAAAGPPPSPAKPADEGCSHCTKLCAQCKPLRCSFCQGAHAAAMCEVCTGACDGCKQCACPACAEGFRTCPGGCGFRACDVCRLERGVSCWCASTRASDAPRPLASARSQLVQRVHPALLASSLEACCSADSQALQALCPAAPSDSGADGEDDATCFGGEGAMGDEDDACCTLGYMSGSGLALGGLMGSPGPSAASSWSQRMRSYSQRRVLDL